MNKTSKWNREKKLCHWDPGTEGSGLDQGAGRERSKCDLMERKGTKGNNHMADRTKKKLGVEGELLETGIVNHA